jgi:translation initiation factor 5B
MKMIRSPICTVVGHIDHGKTSLLDKIRGTNVIKGEAGGITQAISSTMIPIKNIQNICGNLLKSLNLKLTIPGLLFIDTPGHAAFNNLRKRGGNLADIAVLVVDINEGVKDQTKECIEILKQYKTPFIIALNKIDLLNGWRAHNDMNMIQNIKIQSDQTKNLIDKKLYDIVGQLAQYGLNSERFDRVDDYTKQVALIPTSAETGEGLPELLMVMTGLAQRYLEQSLQIETKGEAKGTILEVKEEKGTGVGLDVIIYDGRLKVNDKIVIGNIGSPIESKVRAIFIQENKKLKSIKEVHAAAGVKIMAPNVKEAIGGMPIRVANKDIENVRKEVQKEVEDVLVDVDKEGVIIKADTIGSLEALIGLLRENGIKVKKASIGSINKKDIGDASAEDEILDKVILGFNVDSVENKDVKIICHDVIYKIIEDFQIWKEIKKKEMEKKEMEKVAKPFKIKLLHGCVFRQSGPAVVGVIVNAGVLRVNSMLMKKNGDKAGHVKSIQLEKDNLQEVEKGKEVAVSIPNITVGRQIKEGDELYSDLNENEFIKLKSLKKKLKADEIEVLKEIAEIKRKVNSMWGV